MIISLMLWLRAMRLHQWSKNLLLAVPLMASQHWVSPQDITLVCIAFIAFSLTASGVYLINDIIDMPRDKRHPRKCKRPFAAGLLSPHIGWRIAVALWGIALMVSHRFLPHNFELLLAIYVFVSLAYCLFFKNIPWVDIVLLVGLYCLRLIAGAQVINVPLSMWLIAFAVAIFTSLATVKRLTEITSIVAHHGRSMVRGYRARDRWLLYGIGVYSGVLSVLILSFYLRLPMIKTLYAMPSYLNAIVLCFAIWLSRMWWLIYKRTMNDDPVLYALQDKYSIILIALSFLFYGVAL